MIARRSILSGLLSPLLGLLPKRSQAWADCDRMFLELDGQAIKPVESIEVFRLHCQALHETIDFEHIRQTIDSVNSTLYFGARPGTLRFVGCSWTRGVKVDGKPVQDVLTYEFHLKRDEWGPLCPRVDFNQFPVSQWLTKVNKSPYVYTSCYPKLARPENHLA